MRFEAVSSLFDRSRFPALRERAHPERALVAATRVEVGHAVTDDALLADCIALELRRMAVEERRRGGLTPFYVHPQTGVALAFGFWAPGMRAGAHEHTAWTITAVCRNRLDVLTFDRDESYRQGGLVPKNRFPAQAGAAGFIYEPCIHDPWNTSDAWSLSLHAISPRDGEPAGDEGPVPWLSPPAFGAPRETPAAARAHALRASQIFASFLAEILASMTTDAAEEPLRLAARIAPSRVLAAASRSRFLAAVEEEVRMPFSLERAHPDLVLDARLEGDVSTLYLVTPEHESPELTISDLSHDALRFAAAAPSVDVATLPGALTGNERLAIGDALVESGLFKRVNHHA